ncbi:sce7726 family protein [Mucilaginibacter sp.]|uniref:sce7726 family protein n=1 Tax=Mucilaginibacter sp. TaxID=1882438 RepID=UPI003D111884
MPKTAMSLQINSRSLARLVSNAGFRKMMTAAGARNYGKQLRQTVEKGGAVLPEKCSLQHLLDVSYDHLQKDYRHEYVYKTKLLSDFILKNYTFCDTIILNEFRLGKSVADIALINGSNKIFEIKTELDNADRLQSQLNDYYKVFSQVYIVTHHSLAAKYRAIVNHKVGIIEFTEDNYLQTIREATPDVGGLDNLTMMKALRKNEFLKIVTNINGALPETTPVKLYKTCLELIATIDPVSVQRHFLDTLKARITPAHQLLHTHAQALPEYLKFYCYLDYFSEKQYLALPSRLSCLV